VCATCAVVVVRLKFLAALFGERRGILVAGLVLQLKDSTGLPRYRRKADSKNQEAWRVNGSIEAKSITECR
jgi:hypothetical protein